MRKGCFADNTSRIANSRRQSSDTKKNRCRYLRIKLRLWKERHTGLVHFNSIVFTCILFLD